MNDTEYEIRPFNPIDQPAAKVLILNGLKEHFGWIDPTLNLDLNDIHQYYIKTGSYFAVADKNKNIVGTGGLKQEAKGVGRLVRLSVSQSERRCGIARTLVSHLKEVAAALGYHTLVVETNLDWFGALRLYQGCGFKIYGRDEESVHMKIKLDPALKPTSEPD